MGRAKIFAFTLTLSSSCLLVQESRAQDITAKLGGTTSSETFDVTRSDDTIIFRVSGDRVIDCRGDIKTDRWLASDYNTFLGMGVGGAGNMSHGSGAQGWYNTGLGYHSLYWNTSGSNNTATGYHALYANNTGNNNTATGNYALIACTGSDNTASGSEALRFNTSGLRNTAIGTHALISVNPAGGGQGEYNIGGTGAGCNSGTYSEIDAGQSQFTTSSSREYKENIVPVKANGVLTQMMSIPVTRYDFRNKYCNSE